MGDPQKPKVSILELSIWRYSHFFYTSILISIHLILILIFIIHFETLPALFRKVADEIRWKHAVYSFEKWKR